MWKETLFEAAKMQLIYMHYYLGYLKKPFISVFVQSY